MAVLAVPPATGLHRMDELLFCFFNKTCVVKEAVFGVVPRYWWPLFHVIRVAVPRYLCGCSTLSVGLFHVSRVVVPR